ISTLSAVRKKDITRVGGKGANLGELAGEGFPIPSGFVVSAEAYSIFFASLRLQKLLHSLNKANKEELSRVCGVIRNTITNASFPGELAESILAAHEQLVGNRKAETLCAVRSSATTENLAEVSFAGQHATYYYVERANLLQMIQYCWASLWSKEAVSYRNACGIEHSAAMAVIIQEMICSEISGTTFTADPVTGADEVIIEASWGMGAALVDGRVTPDRYTLDCKTLEVIDQRIAEKTVMVPGQLQKKASSRLTEVPPGLQQQQTLSPDLLKTVATWALKAKKHFGSHQNVEWAIADGYCSILQSFPISFMGSRRQQAEPEGQYVLFQSVNNNSPLEPLTPLTDHLISLAASPVLRPINGYCYLNIKYIRPFFPLSLSDNELVDFFSSSFSHEGLALRKFSLRKLPLSLFLWFGAYLLFGVFWIRSRNISENIAADDHALLPHVKEKKSCSLLGSLLRLSLLPKLFDPIDTIPLWMNASSVQHLLPFFFFRVLVQRWLPELHSEVFALFRIGEKSPASGGMHAALDQLVVKAGQFPAIREQFLNRPPDQVITALKKNPNARPFLRLFKSFLEKHGYRAAKELELQSARWKEHPHHVIRLIQERLLASVDNQHRFDLSREDARLLKMIKEKLETFPLERHLRLRWYLLNFFSRASKRLLKFGENSRSYHLMAMSVVRQKLLCLEKEFMQQGVLKCKGDIFFLQLHEITHIQQGNLCWPDIEERIHQRRHDFIRATRRTPARTIGIALPDSHLTKKSQKILPGQTVSPGSYTGRARVIVDSRKSSELCSGEILVAPYTDSSWTPCFFTAGGAVVEVGSYLSHAGRAAREYSLPCIVDVAGCIQQIQTGDLLWINGEKGEVQILESSQQEKQANEKK
uniref:PEP/pyruvate-binding domain-containing protein n=1 Tax=Candidatus Electrothrix sp. TaxID=2170559 RepID=UPI0040563812